MKKLITLSSTLTDQDGGVYKEENQTFTQGEALGRALKTALNDPATMKPYTIQQSLKFMAWAEEIDEKKALEIDEADIQELIKFVDGLPISVVIKVQIGRSIMGAKETK